jgi:hypothetical protein
MNNEEQIFKSLLKEKLDAQTFEFDEENWLKANQMIEASQKRSKRRFLPLFLFLFFIIGAVSFLIISVKANEAVVSKSDNSTNTDVISNDKKPEAEMGQKTELAIPPSQSKAITTKKVTDKDALYTTLVKTKQQQKNVVNNKSSKTKQLTSAKKVKRTQLTYKKRSKQDYSTYITYTQGKSVIKKQTDIEQESVTSDVSTNAPEVIEDLPQSTMNISTKDSVPPLILIETAVLVSNTCLPVTNTSKNVVLQKDSTKRFKHFFGIELGASYLIGWKNPTKKDAYGVNPHLGFNYTNLLPSNFFYSTGAYYTTVTNLFYSKHVVKNTRYRYSEESNVFEFTPTTLHYIALPLKVGYVLNPKNSIGIGGTVAYLFHTNGNVLIYSDQGGKQANTTTLKTSGYTQGFSSSDIQLNLFYRRQLFKNIIGNVELMYGITDVKNDAFFKYANKENNTGIKVTFIYNFFKK